MKIKKRKIDIVSVPFSGHLLPLLTIIYPLFSEGHDIRVITGKEKISLIDSLGLRSYTILDEGVFENIANTNKRIDLAAMFAQFNKTIKLIEKITDTLIELWSNDRPDIVIADFVAVPVAIACRKLNIPWITTIPSPFVIESKDSPPAYFFAFEPKEGFCYKIRDFFARFIVRNFKNIAFLSLKSNLGKYKDFKLYDKLGNESIYSPYSILGLGIKELEFRKDFPKHFKWAGYKCDSFESISIDLDKLLPNDKKIVLVSCGTHLLWAKTDLIRIAKILSSRFKDFIFLITLGNRKNKDAKPKRINKSIYIFEYLPYEHILAKVDYAIHQGGAGILYNCIEQAIPSLIIPRDYDQFDYALRARYFSIAQTCRSTKKSNLIKSFLDLIESKNTFNLEYMNRSFKKYNPTACLQKEIDRICN